MGILLPIHRLLSELLKPLVRRTRNSLTLSEDANQTNSRDALCRCCRDGPIRTPEAMYRGRPMPQERDLLL